MDIRKIMNQGWYLSSNKSTSSSFFSTSLQGLCNTINSGTPKEQMICEAYVFNNITITINVNKPTNNHIFKLYNNFDGYKFWFQSLSIKIFLTDTEQLEWINCLTCFFLTFNIHWKWTQQQISTYHLFIFYLELKSRWT